MFITKHPELERIEIHFKAGDAFSFMQSDFMEAIQKHPHLKSVVLRNCSFVDLRDDFKKHKLEIQEWLDNSVCFSSFIFNYLDLTKSKKIRYNHSTFRTRIVFELGYYTNRYFCFC